MATMSDWRGMTHLAVDLTGDSDDDDNGPLGTLLKSPASAPRPRQTAIPLPENVRHLYSSSASPAPPHAPSTANAMSLIQARKKKKKSQLPLKYTAQNNAQNNAPPPSSSVRQVSDTPLNYIGISNTVQDGPLGTSMAEKRRKLSMGGRHRSEAPPSQAQELSSRHVAIAGKTNVNTGVKLHNMNGVPTVHTLNSALKSNSAKLSIPSEMLVEEPRALKIGRSSATKDDNAVFGSSRFSTMPLPAVPAHRPTSKSNSPLELELLPSDLEMEDDDWDKYQDVDLTLESIQNRRPLKKEKRHHHNQYKFKRPRASLKPLNPPAQAETPSTLPIDQPRGDDNDSVLGDTPPPPPLRIESHSTSDRVTIPSIPPASQVPLVYAKTSTHLPLDVSSPSPSPTHTPIHASKAASKTLGKLWEEEEDHLLLFLKEVKQMRWPEIQQEMPHRTSATIQTRYSSKMKRRDRSLDPPRLNLPTKYAHEALIDWRSVHGESLVHDGKRSVGRPHNDTITRDLRADVPAVASTRLHNPRASNQHDDSSTSESAALGPMRPRRAVKPIDYTWPRSRSRLNPGDKDVWDDRDDESLVGLGSRELSVTLRSSTEASDQPLVSETVIPIDQQLNVNYDQEDSSLVLSGQTLPFLSFAQRLQIRTGSQNGEWDIISGRNWQGSLLHVDFSREELNIVERVMNKVLSVPQTIPFSSCRKRLQIILERQTEPKLLRLSHDLRMRLPVRTQSSIDAFLQDARTGKLRANPRIDRMGAVRQDKSHSSNLKASISSLIRQRELGLQSRRGWKTASKELSYQVKNSLFDTLGPLASYTGASHDVHTVAWSPDGEFFAAGTVCITDESSMQYNRSNNLLYGDISRTVIHELGVHYKRRQKTQSGLNSTHAMHVTQDDRLFTTVSSVAFSPNGEFMFSTGYDKMVYVWSITADGSQPYLEQAFEHKAEVDVMAVSRHGVLATGSKRLANPQLGDRNAPIKVISNIGRDIKAKSISFGSQKATERPDDKLLPTSLKFEPQTGDYLLAGFGANKRQDHLDLNGDICLWDIRTLAEIPIIASTRNVFDLAWNPIATSQPRFAVGCVAGANVNRGTRSTIRLYDVRDHQKFGVIMELECPALDMNDVTFCPYDENVIAAGCTDGRIYLWDLRYPDTLKYTLTHGASLQPLDEYCDRETTDTGVRYLEWGENATRLYTGSSDGVVKVWDVVRSPDDVFIRDLITADSGIMSGAFSRDYSRLVLGEVNGSVNVLEVSRSDCAWKNMDKFKYISYQGEDTEFHFNIHETEPTYSLPDSSFKVASDSITSGQMVTVPFGNFPFRQTVQGPKYAGPYDSGVDAPHLRELALEFQLSHMRTATTDLQCTLPNCLDNLVKVTNEDIGDSGKSADRIPDQLRKQWEIPGSDRIVVSGKSSCASCGRPARPLDFVDDIDTVILCERCSFACFRCGAHNEIHPETEKITCVGCKRQWDIGVLGYECSEEGRLRTTRIANIPSLKGYERDLFTDESNSWDDATFGDDMNALTDYYYSLAIDRPESPPL
ncbi:Rik1-associated factor 1 [Dendryphion nanum]|uniref:Rik1-associated factor 1 n=1 Tax=Dendryphion nanum TaxID=256645 RepID=A0A9P9IA65_9PLEO|nr:Rik1-associated factor 1 [Dendryphion nanum]